MKGSRIETTLRSRVMYNIGEDCTCNDRNKILEMKQGCRGRERLMERPWLQLMCCAPVSGHEVGHVFRSEGSHQDRGPKELSEGVGLDKKRLGPDDVNLQTAELHCNYSVLIVSAE